MFQQMAYIRRYILLVFLIGISGVGMCGQKPDTLWYKEFYTYHDHDHRGNEDTMVAYAWKAFHIARKYQDVDKQLLALGTMLNATHLDSIQTYIAALDTFPASEFKSEIYGELKLSYYDALFMTLNAKEEHDLLERLVEKADSTYSDSLQLIDKDAEIDYILRNRMYLLAMLNHAYVDSKESPFYPYLERLNVLVNRLPNKGFSTLKINTYLSTSALALEMKEYDLGVKLSERVVQGILNNPFTADNFQDMSMDDAYLCYYMFYQQLYCYDQISDEMLKRNWEFIASPYGHVCRDFHNSFDDNSLVTPNLYYFMASKQYEKAITRAEVLIHEYVGDIETRQQFVEIQNVAIDRCESPEKHMDKLHRNFDFVDEYQVYVRRKKEIDYSNLSQIAELKRRIAADELKEQVDTMRWGYVFLIGSIVIVLLCLWGIYRMYLSRKRKASLIEKLRVVSEKSNEEQRRTEAARKAQSTSLDNMNHEIRSPLNSIVGFSELLLDNPDLDTETKKEFTDQIDTSSNMLLQIINDVLDLSQLESGQYKLENTYCRVHDVCIYAVKSHEHRLQPGVEMVLDFKLPLDTEIFVDKTRLLQILFNFLSNACKHTSEGCVTLGCDWADSSQEEVVFTVADTGDGVPEDKQAYLFERFAKLNHKAQGTGLGLNIAATLAYVMKGSIGYDKEYLEGARFYVVIPKG